MLEIVALVMCCKGLGSILREKGRKPLVFQILLVISWFAAEFMAGIIWGIAQAVMHDGQQPEFDFTIYIIALVAAASAAGFWFLVAWMLPPVNQEYVNPGFGGASGYGAPPTNFGPPADPKNPYAPPRSQR